MVSSSAFFSRQAWMAASTCFLSSLFFVIKVVCRWSLASILIVNDSGIRQRLTTIDRRRFIQPHLLDVVGHGCVQETGQRFARRRRRANRRRGDRLTYLIEQVDCRSAQHEISRGRLLL